MRLRAVARLALLAPLLAAPCAAAGTLEVRFDPGTLRLTPGGAATAWVEVVDHDASASRVVGVDFPQIRSVASPGCPHPPGHARPPRRAGPRRRRPHARDGRGRRRDRHGHRLGGAVLVRADDGTTAAAALRVEAAEAPPASASPSSSPPARRARPSPRRPAPSPRSPASATPGRWRARAWAPARPSTTSASWSGNASSSAAATAAAGASTPPATPPPARPRLARRLPRGRPRAARAGRRPLTRRELAHRLGLAQEGASHHLRSPERLGLLRTHRGTAGEPARWGLADGTHEEA